MRSNLDTKAIPISNSAVSQPIRSWIAFKSSNKLKFIMAAALLVLMAMFVSSLFNLSSLEKMYMEVLVEDLAQRGSRVATVEGLYHPPAAPVLNDTVPHRLNNYRKLLLDDLEPRSKNSDSLRALTQIDPVVSVVGSNGMIRYSTDSLLNGRPLPISVTNDLERKVAKTGRIRDGQIVTYSDQIHIAYQVYGLSENPSDLLLLSLKKSALSRALRSEVEYRWDRFWKIAFLAICALVIVLYLVIPSQARGERLINKRNTVIIIGLCVSFQIIYSYLFVDAYKQQLLQLKRAEISRVKQHFSENLAAFATLELDEAKAAVNNTCTGLLRRYDSIGSIRIHLKRGFDYYLSQATDLNSALSSYGFSLFFKNENLDVHSSKDTPSDYYNQITISLSKKYVVKMLSEMIMDCATILVISSLLFIEFLFFLNTAFQKINYVTERRIVIDYRLMRPAAFLLLFAIDLSMSFIPLHMNKLYQPILGLSKDLVLGLPITVEFICVGVSIFLSGFWLDRKGWHPPFITGLVLTVSGILYSWCAPTAIQFILSRAFVGSGYGLTLMAAQGFVISNSDSNSKARGLAELFAGIYAGSISGGVTGAMIADRFGYNFVFLIGAVIVIFILLYCFMFLRAAMVAPASHKKVEGAISTKPKVGFVGFCKNRIVIALIVFSSLPAAIAVVGFLNYFSPIYLNSMGVSQSSIGRILMVYGVCLVYVGPSIAKFVDLSSTKKNYVFIGCFLGSLTFLLFYFTQGVVATIVAVLCLGVSSSFVLTSQAAYMLNLKVTQSFGEGKAIGIFRSSSRIGQALGPIVFSVVLSFGNLEKGIQIFGLIYLMAALIFILLTQRDKHHSI